MKTFKLPDPEGRLPGELEVRYRRWFLAADVNHAIVGMMLVALPLIPFAYSDYYIFGIGLKFFVLLAMRSIFFLYTLVLLLRLKKINDPGIYDLQVLIWGLIGVALTIALEVFQPPEYIYHYVFNIISIFIIYLGIPNRLSFRFYVATLITAGEMFRYYLIWSSLDLFTSGIILAALLLANIVGFVLSARLYYYRRRQFLAQMEVEEMKERFKEMAATDALTGIFNRRKFMELAENEMSRFLRYRSPFTFLMLDIDHFKELNDSQGHTAGDHFLREFTLHVAGQVRGSDIFGRLGGEEFGLILVETPLQHAASIAERIRKDVSSIRVSGRSGFTVSIGMVQPGESEVSLEEVMQRADAALYRAKQNGRDRVQSA